MTRGPHVANPEPSGPPTEPGTTKVRSREGAIDAFRWICILAVLVQHSVFPTRQSTETVAALLVAKEWLSWCVVGFFLVSGWLANPRDAGWNGIRTRTSRLLKPFLGVNLVLALSLVAMAFAGLAVPQDYQPLDPWFHVRQLVSLQGLGPQFYFLPCLLLLGGLSLVVVRMFGRRWAVVVATAIATVMALVHGIPEAAYGSQLDRYPLYALSFCLGMALREDPRSKLVWGLVAIGLVGGVALAASDGATSLFFATLSVPLFVGFRSLVRGPVAWLVPWSSGALFLWHSPLVMTACSMALARLGCGDGLELLGMWIGTILACQGIHRIVQRSRLAAYLTL